jgi:hypothetical protein
MATSPTARTLERLRTDGYMVQVVERWNQFSHRRVDLFGFVDVLAVGNGETLGVQATSGDHVQDRIAKISGECAGAALRWLAVPSNSLEVWGWRKLKGRGRQQWFRVRWRIAGTDDGRLVATKLLEENP